MASTCMETTCLLWLRFYSPDEVQHCFNPSYCGHLHMTSNITISLHYLSYISTYLQVLLYKCRTCFEAYYLYSLQKVSIYNDPFRVKRQRQSRRVTYDTSSVSHHWAVIFISHWARHTSFRIYLFSYLYSKKKQLTHSDANSMRRTYITYICIPFIF
jgi:hypothetical protein